MPPGHVLAELGREAFSGVRTLAVAETSFKHALAAGSQFGLTELPRTLAVRPVPWIFYRRVDQMYGRARELSPCSPAGPRHSRWHSGVGARFQIFWYRQGLRRQ